MDTDIKVFHCLNIKSPRMPDSQSESECLDCFARMQLARINTLGVELEVEFPNPTNIMVTATQHPNAGQSKA